MQYDSVKRSLGNVFNRNPFLRKCFYGMLDVLLLRAWHIKKELRRLKKKLPPDAQILDAGAGFGQYAYYLSKLERVGKSTLWMSKPNRWMTATIFFRK